MGLTRDVGAILKAVMSETALREQGGAVSKIVPNLIKDPSRIPEIDTNEADEFKALKAASEYLTAEFGGKVLVEKSAGSSHPKASLAMPGKPAISVS